MDIIFYPNWHTIHQTNKGIQKNNMKVVKNKIKKQTRKRPWQKAILIIIFLWIEPGREEVWLLLFFVRQTRFIIILPLFFLLFLPCLVLFLLISSSLNNASSSLFLPGFLIHTCGQYINCPYNSWNKIRVLTSILFHSFRILSANVPLFPCAL